MHRRNAPPQCRQSIINHVLCVLIHKVLQVSRFFIKFATKMLKMKIMNGMRKKMAMAALVAATGAWAQAPVIGIAASPGESSQVTGKDYVTAVTKAGGIPLLIPATSDPALIEATLDHVDGVLLTGGVDVDPAYYGEEPHPMLGEVNAARDTFEMLLIHKAVERKMPLFGVCRGMQVINVALGGTLWQDIPSQVPEAIAHRVTGDSLAIEAHTVTLVPGTLSERLLGSKPFAVNSRHHQAVRDVAPRLLISGHSPDGIAEMLEGYPVLPILAVQWHPENFVAAGDRAAMLRFFTFLVEESAAYRERLKMEAENNPSNK